MFKFQVAHSDVQEWLTFKSFGAAVNAQRQFEQQNIWTSKIQSA